MLKTYFGLVVLMFEMRKCFVVSTRQSLCFLFFCLLDKSRVRDAYVSSRICCVLLIFMTKLSPYVCASSSSSFFLLSFGFSAYYFVLFQRQHQMFTFFVLCALLSLTATNDFPTKHFFYFCFFSSSIVGLYSVNFKSSNVLTLHTQWQQK